MLGGGEQRLERVVARDQESSDVGQELTAKVKDDKEKVERNETDDGVGLGDRSALLEIVQGGVPGQLKATQVSIMAIASASASGPSDRIKLQRTSLSSCPMYCWTRS